MVNVFIVLGFIATYFVLLGIVRFCEFILGEKKSSTNKSPSRKERS